jgi:hypothetical protein
MKTLFLLEHLKLKKLILKSDFCFFFFIKSYKKTNHFLEIKRKYNHFLCGRRFNYFFEKNVLILFSAKISVEMLNFFKVEEEDSDIEFFSILFKNSFLNIDALSELYYYYKKYDKNYLYLAIIFFFLVNNNNILLKKLYENSNIYTK